MGLHYIVKNDTLYENSPMKRHFITRWSITATICRIMHWHWLDVTDRVRFRVCVQMFKCLHGMAPDYLSTMCHPASRLPGRQNLRSANRGQLDVPRATLSSCGVRAFVHAGPSLWNTLPVHLKNRNLTLTTFMRCLKSYISFSQYWFRIERVWGVIT